MKKLLFLAFCFSSFISCTGDNSDLNLQNDSLLEINAHVEVLGCNSAFFSYANLGKMVITTDEKNLYVTVIASQGFSLQNTKLHIAETLEGFPTVGQGNLSPGQMEYNLDFSPEIGHYPFIFPLSQYDGCIYIASQSAFSNGQSTTSLWAGGILGDKGGWSYFEYCVQECPPSCEPVNLGPDRVIEITQVDVEKLRTDGAVAAVYLRPLGEISWEGTFYPTIRQLVERYAEEGPGDYITEYTAGEDKCTDTVELTLRIISTP